VADGGKKWQRERKRDRETERERKRDRETERERKRARERDHEIGGRGEYSHIARNEFLL